MTHTSIDALKSKARMLRGERKTQGKPMSHSQALEVVARGHGYRDWNTAHARLSNLPRPPELGQMVSGCYMGQPINAEVIGVQSLQSGTAYRLKLEFSEPVDVVRFESFSNFRRRVSCVVDAQGRSAEKLSDGTRHMVLDL